MADPTDPATSDYLPYGGGPRSVDWILADHEARVRELERHRLRVDLRFDSVDAHLRRQDDEARERHDAVLRVLEERLTGVQGQLDPLLARAAKWSEADADRLVATVNTKLSNLELWQATFRASEQHRRDHLNEIGVKQDQLMRSFRTAFTQYLIPLTVLVVGSVIYGLDWAPSARKTTTLVLLAVMLVYALYTVARLARLRWQRARLPADPPTPPPAPPAATP